MPGARKLKRRYRTRQIARAILVTLLIGAGIAAVSLAPGSVSESLIRYFFRRRVGRNWSPRSTPREKRFKDSFSYLKAHGLISVTRVGRQLYVSLTEEGKRRARYYQIDELEIEKPRDWDGKWRVLIFDIPEKIRLRRDLLRGKLKELGFVKIQRSVWAHPYPCQEELELLRDFFGLTSRSILMFETETLGIMDRSLAKELNQLRLVNKNNDR